MYRHTLIFAALCSFVICTMPTQAKSDENAATSTSAPTITVTKLDVSTKTLKLSYEIRNASEQDIWICEDISVNLHDYDFEAYMEEDRQTLLIRRRLDVNPPGSVGAPPDGRYVRLRQGQVRTESLFLSLPVESRFFWGSPTAQGKAYARSLALEIGYYPGDMPGMIRGILEEAEKSPRIAPVGYPTYPTTIRDWFGSLLRFNFDNCPNGLVRHRDEELVIPWTGDIRMGERILRVTIDAPPIPYEEKYDRPNISPPDLNRCTRLDIRYQPSMLDYFFPYPNERTLMSTGEVEYLQSLQTVVADDQERLAAFAHEVAKGGLIGGILTERSTAYVTCYRGSERLTSFTIYDDRAIMTEQQQCIRYGIGLPSLKMLTPPIEPFQLRLECAENLKNLSSLLHLLYSNRKTYRASDWCAAIVRDRRANDVPTEYKMRCFKCRAASEGKCHYAMNPNCRPDSPADMVLLFETKAGWNQHGGPELFTFDNHDPKGGCVLLNDGTVKFIRTKEELQQLHWK